MKSGDILKIDISTRNPEATQIYNPIGSNTNVFNTKDALIYNGFIIDNAGYINLPITGDVYSLGLTLLELKETIIEKITKEQILTNPTVDIKLLNTHFTILGEVTRPGRYEFLKNNLNIFEAIGMAGDLTINGIRDDIKLIRDNDGDKSVFSIDLTDTKILSNNKFQIISGDIIIVNPNSTRVKNAGIIGNAGTLLSLLSFLLSSIIITTNR